jgi:DNA-binding beta-propeller fold protein YncE
MSSPLVRFPLGILSLFLLGTPPLSAEAAPQFLLKWGTTGLGNGQFDEPSGIAVDASGNVYVVDRFNDRVQKFSSTGVHMTHWGGSGTGAGQFDSPRGIAVDASGHVYVADAFNARIQKFTSSGAYVLQWGTLGNGDGQFSAPRAITVDGSGFVYVTDDGFSLKRVQKFTSTGTFVTKWGSSGTGDGEFSGPRGVAVDGNGDVYVSDALNNRIQKFSSTGSFLAAWGTSGSAPGQLSLPAGLAWGNGSLWVADLGNNRVQEFTGAGVFVQSLGSLCRQSDGLGCSDPDGGGELEVGDGQFYNPQAVMADPAGTLYVADSENDRVQKLGTPQVTGIGDAWGSDAGVRIVPNPAPGSARITFEVQGASPHVEARIVDLGGRLVRVLASGPRPAGTHVLVWDGLTGAGVRAPRGIYFVRIAESGTAPRTVKLVRAS